MARSHSIIGLSDRAKKLVKRLRPCDTSKAIEDAFGGVSIYYLRKYKNHWGRTVYTEFIQDEPWASGPCTFLALKDKDGNDVKESLWTDDEIYNSI